MKLSPGTRVRHMMDGSEGTVVEWRPDLLATSGYVFSEEYKWCKSCDSSTDGYVTVEFDNGCGPEIAATRFLKTVADDHVSR